MKTTLFNVFFKGWDIRNQNIFNSKVNNNHASNPNVLFDASNNRKYQKVIQNGLQKDTQNPLKIIKNPSRDIPGSISVHL